MATDSLRLRWDMDVFFPGGSKSKQFEDFRESISKDLAVSGRRVSDLSSGSKDDNTKAWQDLMVMIEDLNMRLHHAGSFAFCLSAQDVNDEHAMVIIQELSSMEAELEAIKTGVEELAISMDDVTWKELLR